MYVLGNFIILGYKSYSLSALIDTGATICTCRWNVLPSEKWMLMKSPIAVKGIDGKETKIKYKAKNVAKFPNMHGDFLLGNLFKFLDLRVKLRHHIVHELKLQKQ